MLARLAKNQIARSVTLIIYYLIMWSNACVFYFYRTKPVEKPKELVIPLIHKNRWYRQDAERGDKSGEDKTKDKTKDSSQGEQDTVESQAVKELIEGVWVDYFSFCRLWLCFKIY